MVAGIEAALILLKQTENDPRARGGAAVFLSVDHRPASLLQSFMAEQAASGKGTYESLESGGFEAKFDEKDAVGWALSLRAWWRRCMDKHAFRPPSSEPENVGRNDFRVALLGDWGTGLYGAPVCSSSIRKTKYDVLLHLGDDYYAGTEPEVEGRFLKVWPDVSGAISRAINSNHEMYSGGNAYFRQTLAAFHQSSSLFALRSNHWLLIGLDSAYEGNDRSGGRLSDMQIGWVTTLVNDAVANGQRVILFSHHQPFSLYDNQGSVLATCIEGVLNSRRVFAWYWGHEHRCVIFERHPQWQLFGRCIGHSGFPYFRDIFPG
ncbi:MAG: metallophosphoesterase, partial [Deltaproteobacteria bacterium]|nr:metallophosphoesterase [Deltaproteobacteria bacterium]